MEPLSYLHLQMKLEGIEASKDCFIRQVELVPGEELPLVLLAQFTNRPGITYYDEGLAPDLKRVLSAVQVEFPEVAPFLTVLRSRHLQTQVGHYKTYVFPARPEPDLDVVCLSRHDPRVQAFGFDALAEQVYAIEGDGILVCACVSTRENEACGEAWVYTAPDYRKRGFAQKAVNAWARSLMEAGKVPFYSHDIKNEASANLAGKLGLLPVFEEIVITRMQF